MKGLPKFTQLAFINHAVLTYDIPILLPMNFTLPSYLLIYLHAYPFTELSSYLLVLLSHIYHNYLFVSFILPFTLHPFFIPPSYTGFILLPINLIFSLEHTFSTPLLVYLLLSPSSWSYLFDLLCALLEGRLKGLQFLPQ